MTLTLDTCAVTPSGPWKSCAHDRIEPMWDLDLHEETGRTGPFVMYTGAYTSEEFAALPRATVFTLIEQLKDSIDFHEANIDGHDGPLNGRPANDCERRHLDMYKHDLGVLTARVAS